MADGESASSSVDPRRFFDDADRRSQTGVVPVLFGRRDLIPEVLPPGIFRDSLTDSSTGSTPDYDHFLSKTLMQQSEPLSLTEMEEYLQRLYQPSHDSIRSGVGAGVPVRGARPTTVKSKQDQDFDFEGEYSLTDFSRGVTSCGVAHEDDVLVRRTTSGSLDKSNALKDLNVDPKSSLNLHVTRLNNDVKSSRPIPKTTNVAEKIGLRKLAEQTDYVMEKADRLGPLPKPVELKRTLTDVVNPGDFRPVFTLGDTGEYDENVETLESSVRGICDGRTTSVSKVRDDVKGSQGQGLAVRSLHKSVSCPSKPALKSNCGAVASKVNSLLKNVTRKEMAAHQNANVIDGRLPATSPCVPTDQQRIYFRRCVQKSASMVFHANTGLPLQSSPVPAKKISSGSFDYDSTLNSVRAIKNSLSCINLDAQNNDSPDLERIRTYSTSAPASTNCLLGNFEESLINGRIEPSGVVNGFTVDIGASGSFCPQHITLPVTAFFFSLSDDNAPSPYLGHINLESYSKRGYHIPKQGTIQVTLFNPNTTVVKMFVVKYDMSDMPPNHQTVLRQRTLYMPVKGSPSDVPGVMVYLRYLIHLRFSSSKSNKIYLHTDIRVIFARDKFELDSRVANYELRSFTEGPENPRFSPRR